jgi:hypothetical protein
VVYANGARETIRDRVVKADQTKTSHNAVLVVSEYSGLDGSRAVRADLPQTNPSEMTEVETGYVVEDGYISRIASLGGRSRIRLEERGFLPQYLRPNRVWSNTLSPLANFPTLTITQNHRSVLEGHDVVVPAGHFAECIRIETEASYQSPVGVGDKRYFTDWYAPDVGLVKTLVLSGGREIARIDLLRFVKSQATAPLLVSNRRSIVSSSSEFANGVTATAGPPMDR